MDKELIPYRDQDVNIDVLWDTLPDGKRYKKRIGVQLPEDLYKVISNGLLHNPALPFAGDLDYFFTYAAAEVADSLKNFLDSGNRSMLHDVREIHKNLSAEL